MAFGASAHVFFARHARIALQFHQHTGRDVHRWASTNVALPLNSWTKLGYLTNTSAGQYQFTDTNALANASHFYRVSSP